MLLIAIFGHLPRPEHLVNLAVHLVLIQPVHARAYGRQALLGGGQPLVALVLGPSAVGAQPFNNGRSDGLLHVDALQQLAQPIRHVLLAHIGQTAFAAPVRAAVIDVLAFLQLGSDGAAVMGTAQQPGEGEIMLTVLRFVMTAEYILHALKELRWDQRVVLALVFDPLPDEVPEVETVLEDGF